MASIIAGLYFAISNNACVESILNKFPTMGRRNPSPSGDDIQDKEDSTRIRVGELAAFTNRALTIAVLCNMHRFPIRVPIIMVLTPPIARFLARKYYEIDSSSREEAGTTVDGDDGFEWLQDMYSAKIEEASFK